MDMLDIFFDHEADCHEKLRTRAMAFVGVSQVGFAPPDTAISSADQRWAVFGGTASKRMAHLHQTELVAAAIDVAVNRDLACTNGRRVAPDFSGGHFPAAHISRLALSLQRRHSS
ncbi:hypothetical protein IVB09_38710 [Bradyrhizobium sp. 174]|nr:hypothetical protein [Bradyrhizobium sp. 174]